VKYPTEKELVDALKRATCKADQWDCNEGLDVRLQVTDSAWFLHIGDPSYDTDHSGVWADNCVFPDTEWETLVDVAIAMIETCQSEA
jgi:hypothetical protein